MLAGREQKPIRLTRTNRNNLESEQLPDYLRSSFSDTVKVQEPPKVYKGKKILPEYAFGNSLETPSFFRNPNTLICRDTYDNPFIKARVKPRSKWESLHSSTLNNFEFYNVSEQKFMNLPNQGYKNVKIVNTVTNKVHYVQTPQVKGDEQTFQLAYRTLQKTGLFGRKNELFTDFVEKNDNQNVYGHLNDRQRPKGHLRDVKNYSFTPQEFQIHKRRASHYLNSSSNKVLQKSDLPIVNKNQQQKDQQVEKYFSRDQSYLNSFNNSIIVTQIDQQLKGKKRDRYRYVVMQICIKFLFKDSGLLGK
ncbi:unnamed protein product (macronuclear) [Paramecium tetraurelia]|uniref:Uncharacterized protein n=1 Tax=Paramecium tetraurelia TaxID=5888 RepID=A0DCX3_PARTE|nr:uncharacterized protein GSPATT00015749001 [Paramecium tetraurelia]CAK80890.1 unnamed protein product [Paramecium tetraurelia]|eukprot:XP_001448287.1 hypothetical protein (macronuclear) [Paramecium tetraurelia strain d4-2]